MIKNRRLKYSLTLFLSPLLISGLLLHLIIITLSHAASTITSDGTMGTNITQAGTTHNINGGTIKGTNQFHSFGLFSVGTGDTASFNGPPVISNIIGRVTGGQQSVIDGILKSTITGANLYLLNPYGVLFGKNASLDLSGSFHVSTADYLKLSDGGMFYSSPLKSSVLTVAAPSAFGFLSNNVVPITIQGSFLQVPKGKTLSIIGGDINITNQSPGYLSAPCGQINLVSVASPGELNLSDFSTNSFSKLGNITIFQPSWNAGGIYADGSNYDVDPGGTIIIRGGQIFFENTNLNARGNPGGTLSIKGEQLHLDDTYISTGTRGAVNHPGTGVDINVTGDVLLTNGSEIASSSVGVGRAGDIRITAGNIQLGDDDPTKSLYRSTGFYGDLGSRAFGPGPGGNVYITADNLTVKNGFYINTAALSSGDAGNVTVRASTLNLLDGGSISSNGFAIGKGGTVDIVAQDVLLSEKNIPNFPMLGGFFTGLAAQTSYGSQGGLLRVTADSLQILDGGKISTTIWSVGSGANIEITAKSVLISGVVIDNKVSPPDIHASIDVRVIGNFANGTGGNINIIADSLQVTNGGFIGTALYSNAPGNAGNITIQTGTLEVSDRGGIFASSWYGTGNSGRLDITAKDVRIIGLQSSSDPFAADFTGFSTDTNAGLGGDLRLTTDSLLITDRGSITAASYGSGRGGNIGINAGSVEVLNGSNILSSAFGSGNGGKIEVIADSVLISGVHPEPFLDITGHKSLSPSGIASQAGLMGGSAGDVQITAGTLNVLDGARISTETYGSGNGGNIEVTANNVLVSGANAVLREFLIGQGIDVTEAGILARSGILAGTNSSLLGDGATGNAGNVSIQAQNLQLSDQGLISTRTTGPGTGGNIELISDQVTLSGGALISAESSISAKAGKAGDISINVYDIFQIDNSSVSTAAEQAKGGDITIQAGEVQLTNGALISAESSGKGDAGNIDIATGSLSMRDSSITTEAKQADGGNIHIQAGYMVNLIDSKITASVGGGPKTVGGNITIDPHYVILNDSQIIANAYEGKGGNIRIIADVFLASPESVVDASSALGIDGTVDIRAPITNISGTLAPMQGKFLSTEMLLRDRCIARIRGERISSFVVTGRDGLPVRPGGVLPSPIY
jgi:filamentous hemagglutinin family protein